MSIFDDSLRWLDLPAAEFLDYARAARRTPYDGIREDPSVFRREATFLQAQAHRIWLTLRMLEPLIEDQPSFTLLDVGAFPFAVDEAIRYYLRRKCRIVATVAQRLTGDSLACLHQAAIEILPVNLDPQVRMPDPLPGMTDYLPLADNSVDCILFAHVIEHLYHPIDILREMIRVLKPGGKLLLTTDHGMLLGGLLNYLNDGRYLHEPVEGTAAMVFDEWRGHVRFYTEGDLRTLLEAAGGHVLESRLYEVLYNSVPEEYFVDPFVRMPRWRAKLLTEFPQLRNEIMLLAEKAPGTCVYISNPLDAKANAKELADLAHDFAGNQCILNRATMLDLAIGSRLFLGRWPTRSEMQSFRLNPPRRGVDELVESWLDSPEFSARALGVRLERPGPSCIVMTETQEGLRFFFSAQDTFVGFPVAVGVFEPDVRSALDRIVKPGMNCVDVGANIGYHSIRMAAVVGREGGRVFSFEPDPFSFGLLMKNIAENRLEHAISAFQCACGDEEGEVILFRDPNPANFGGAYTRKSHEAAESTEMIAKVAMRRLDDLLPDDVRIHVVKMDVEGYEPFVFHGMMNRIRKDRPVIVSEFDVPALMQWGDLAPAAFLSSIRDEGYVIVEASSFGRGEMEEFVYPQEKLLYANLVCVPGSADESKRGLV